MNLPQLLAWLRRDPSFMSCVTRWEVLPAQPAKYAPFPEGLHPALVMALKSRGIAQLYTHQSEAVAQALAGKSTVVVTPTASGKTLCYNLPVVHSILTDPSARALYLFPTKALAQDQLAQVKELIEPTGAQIHPYVYDGDTPANLRPPHPAGGPHRRHEPRHAPHRDFAPSYPVGAAVREFEVRGD